MEEQKQPQKKKKLSRILYWLLLVLLAAVFLYSGGALLNYYLDSRESQQTYDEIRDIKGDYTRPSYDPQATVPSEAATAPTESPYTTVTDPESGEPVEVLKEFAQLYTEIPISWAGSPFPIPMWITPWSIGPRRRTGICTGIFTANTIPTAVCTWRKRQTPSAPPTT